VLRAAALCAIAALAAAACTSGDKSSNDSSTSAAASTTVPAGPAPGITADTIKIGVTYPDTSALKNVGLSYNLGDFEATYTALAKKINDAGGIDGRKVELVFAPIDPTSPAPADQACVRLTEDEKVFMVTGFFLADAVLCPVATHKTAVVGGGISPDRLEQAAAPWTTPLVDNDLSERVVKKFHDQGLLDGKVAVYAATADTEEFNTVNKTLDDLGVETVDKGIMSAPANDTVATQTQTQTLAQRFKAQGADTVVVVGASGANWPTSMASDTSYRPKLLFVDLVGAQAFSTNKATTDTSILNGSYAGGLYGPNEAIFDEANMQKCVSTLKAAGLKVPSPDQSGDDASNQPFQAAFAACPNFALLQGWLEAAGKTLNYGTLNSALEKTFKVSVPGEPKARTFGPGSKLDGDPVAYTFHWDATAKDYVLDKG
jgi:hypothetical protein